MKFLCEVSLEHTYRNIERIEVEVEAEDEESAMILADEKVGQGNPDSFLAECIDTTIDDILIIAQCNRGEGASITPRCKSTYDMFKG